MPRTLLVLGLVQAACGRFAFDDRAPDAATGDAPAGPEDAASRAPVHVYALDGSYADEHGGRPLTARGGSLAPSGGYQFGANQGLDTVGPMPTTVYTLELAFSFSEVTGWRKLVDISNLDLEQGLYVWDNTLTFVIIPSVKHVVSVPRFQAGRRARVTLTRDAAGVVAGYVDGSPAISFTDTMGTAALNAANPVFHFFIDDNATSNEASPGEVRRIEIFDVALTAAEIAAR